MTLIAVCLQNTFIIQNVKKLIDKPLSIEKKSCKHHLCVKLLVAMVTD
jgi:hypothetical protein